MGKYIKYSSFTRQHKIRQKKKNANGIVYAISANDEYVIDAHEFGNIARFINHSCDPNCRAMKWYINGYPHIAISAIRDLYPMEEITFNYGCSQKLPKAFDCICESEKCQGRM